MFEWLSKLEFKEIFWAGMFLTLTVAAYNIQIDTSGLTNGVTTLWYVLPEYIAALMTRLFSFSIILSLLLVVAIIYLSDRVIKQRALMDVPFKAKDPEEEKVEDYTPPPIVNERWESVVKHINSENPNDWKLAILECDIMLGDLLEKIGYHQDSIGEKLKAVEPSDFTNIESAWEAHKIRNAIAHEGTEFAINNREAKRVIGLYEVVFREFEFI